MTKTQIEYVLAIAKERSFRRAAESCFVTQPTLSAQVQKLEEELGVVLFDRSKSPVRPTRVGELVIEQAQKANDEFMRIKDIADEEKGSIKGDLTIAAIPTISPYLMPEILAPLRSKYPELNLNIYELTTENALAALVKEEVDVAFLATKEDPKKFKQEEIGVESMFLYARKGDPIGTSKEIKISDIKLDSLWLLEEGHCLRDEILDACKLQKEKNLRPQNMIFKTGSIQALINIVDRFGGYTILPEMAVKDIGHLFNGRLIELSKKQISRKIYVTVRRSYLKRQSIKAVTEIAKGLWN